MRLSRLGRRWRWLARRARLQAPRLAIRRQLMLEAMATTFEDALETSSRGLRPGAADGSQPGPRRWRCFSRKTTSRPCAAVLGRARQALCETSKRTDDDDRVTRRRRGTARPAAGRDRRCGPRCRPHGSQKLFIDARTPRRSTPSSRTAGAAICDCRRPRGGRGGRVPWTGAHGGADGGRAKALPAGPARKAARSTRAFFLRGVLRSQLAWARTCSTPCCGRLPGHFGCFRNSAGPVWPTWARCASSAEMARLG